MPGAGQAGDHPLCTPGGRQRLWFRPEDRKSAGIIASASVRENMVLALQAQRGWLHPLSRKEQDEITARLIEQLAIKTPGPEQPIQFLSGATSRRCCSPAGCSPNPSS